MRRPAPPQLRSVRDELRARYDRLWSQSIDRIASGQIDLDPVLKSGVPDQRRGLTLIIRPSAAVRRSVADFLAELRTLAPGQYYYSASELHVTVLSLFTAAINSAPLLAQTQEYAAAVEVTLAHDAPMRIDFEGVTASSGTVMIQGFPTNDSLNEMRDKLRAELRDRGLGSGLDQRYLLRTAHMTVCRFRTSLANSERFAGLLQRDRRRGFGSSLARSVTLVQHDWYMSRHATKTIKCYHVGGPSKRALALGYDEC